LKLFLSVESQNLATQNGQPIDDSADGIVPKGCLFEDRIQRYLAPCEGCSQYRQALSYQTYRFRRVFEELYVRYVVQLTESVIDEARSIHIGGRLALGRVGADLNPCELAVHQPFSRLGLQR
jgi:hypothetical protein